MDTLKSEAGKVHVTDIMVACSHLKEENKYVQAGYREEYNHIYIESFIMGIKKIRKDKNSYPGFINVDEFQKALKTLKNNKKKQKRILKNIYSFSEYTNSLQRILINLAF